MRSRSRALLALALLPVVAWRCRAPVTVHLAGDSTMAEKRPDRRPETGWGEMLQRHFDPRAVVVRNHAMNGRSTRSFVAEGRWQALLSEVLPGDYVFVQFGHNDESPEKGDRYAPPADYRRNLERFVDDVRARRATPVLFTPVVRRRFAGDSLRDTHGEYPDIVRAVAAARQVTLVDAERATRALVQRLGPDSSRALFLHLRPGEHANHPQGVADDTHFSTLGAARRRSRGGGAADVRDSARAASGGRTAVSGPVEDSALPLRLARADDVDALTPLIASSVRALGAGYYDERQIESAIRHVFGVDTQLVRDGTYFVIDGPDGPVACGGWSWRATLYGGDQHKPHGEDSRLDPAIHPARIRAFFVHPAWARRGLASRLVAACEAAAEAEGFATFELAATLSGVPFYRALGFEAREPITVALPDGVELPVVRMVRPIRPSPGR